MIAVDQKILPMIKKIV